jgi:hypothetical protein
LVLLFGIVVAQPADAAYMCLADKPPFGPPEIKAERAAIKKRFSALEAEKQKARHAVEEIKKFLDEVIADSDEDAIPPARKALRIAQKNFDDVQTKQREGVDIVGRTCNSCAKTIIADIEKGLTESADLPNFACQASSKYWNCVRLIEGHCANHCGNFFRTRSVLATLEHKSFNDNGIRAALATAVKGARPICP